VKPLHFQPKAGRIHRTRGTSFDYQFRRLEQIASQINELGLSAVLGQKLSAETAEAKRIDRSQGDSTMMVIAQNVQDMIDNCLQFHAQYLGQATAAGSCRINRDFIGARLEPQEIQSLLQLYTARHYHPRNTAPAAIRRRGARG
jgi:hypothetical protein